MHLGQPHPDHEELQRRVEHAAPDGVHIIVDHWYGYEPELGLPLWHDPVYVTGIDQRGNELHAVCDLDAASVEDQAAFIVDQLFA